MTDDSDDDNLWKDITKDIKPLKNDDHAPRVKIPRLKTTSYPFKKTSSSVQSVSLPVKAGREIDHHLMKRWRSGKLPIDQTLDLHGLSQIQARTAVTDFIMRNYKKQQRVLLIITGKGQSQKSSDDSNWGDPQKGILKQRVPHWLDEPPLRHIVLQYHGAKQHHGGEGALYVLLRRQREHL